MRYITNVANLAIECIFLLTDVLAAAVHDLGRVGHGKVLQLEAEQVRVILEHAGEHLLHVAAPQSLVVRRHVGLHRGRYITMRVKSIAFSIDLANFEFRAHRQSPIAVSRNSGRHLIQPDQSSSRSRRGQTLVAGSGYFNVQQSRHSYNKKAK